MSLRNSSALYDGDDDVSSVLVVDEVVKKKYCLDEFQPSATAAPTNPTTNGECFVLTCETIAAIAAQANDAGHPSMAKDRIEMLGFT